MRLRNGGRYFALALAGLALLALALRVVYGLGLNDPSGDAAFYHDVANGVADGNGFENPYLGVPTAAHPPLFPLLLSVVSLLGGTSATTHQIAGCAFGALTVVVVGLVGRRIGGDGAGLAGAALCTVYPPMIANDSLLLSESLYGLAIALVLLAALRALDEPSRSRVLALGALIGLATLVRTEALLLVVLLGVPLARKPGFGTGAVVALALAAIAVVAPWAARNWIAFDRPVLVSTNDASVIAGANCPRSYGPLIGGWDLDCAITAGLPRGGGEAERRALAAALATGRVPPDLRRKILAGGRNEAAVAARERSAGLRYARDHAGRIPKVVAARVGRTWGVYRVRQQVRANGFLRGSPAWLEWLTVAAFALVAVLAVAGAVILRRRGGPLFVLAAPVILVTVTSAIGFGTPRFRAAAEVALVLLAGVALARIPVALRGLRKTA